MTDRHAETRAAIAESMAALDEYRRQRLAPRIEAGLCCEHIHPTGTRRWRYCRKPSAGSAPSGLTYCAKHLSFWS